LTDNIEEDISETSLENILATEGSSLNTAHDLAIIEEIKKDLQKVHTASLAVSNTISSITELSESFNAFLES
ncbi:unnamed protein product, partial [Rotaria sp. Silwood1]